MSKSRSKVDYSKGDYRLGEASLLPVTPCVCGGERTVLRAFRLGRQVICGSCGATHWQLRWENRSTETKAS
jgi:hypothetical protein